MDKNESISSVCNEKLSWPIFCLFSKLHKHLGPNHFFIGFLKSTKFATDLIFSGSEFHI